MAVLDYDQWLEQQESKVKLGVKTNASAGSVTSYDDWLKQQGGVSSQKSIVRQPDKAAQTQGVKPGIRSVATPLPVPSPASSPLPIPIPIPRPSPSSIPTASFPPSPNLTEIAGLLDSVRSILKANPSGIVPTLTPGDVQGYSPFMQKAIGMDQAGTKALLEQVNPVNALIGAATASSAGFSPLVAKIATKVLPLLFAAPAIKQGAETFGTAYGTPANQTTPLQTGQDIGVGTTETGMGLAAAGLGGRFTKMLRESVESAVNASLEAKGLRVQSPQTEAELSQRGLQKYLPPVGTVPGVFQSHVATTLPPTDEERRTIMGVPESYVPPSELTSRALTEAQPGYIHKPGEGEHEALGQLWRERISERGGGLVKPGTEVQAPAAPDETRGKISFGAEAKANAIPSMDQQRERLYPDDTKAIERFLAEEKIKGEPVNFPSQNSPYQQWREAPSQAEYLRSRLRANVERGLTIEEKESTDIPDIPQQEAKEPPTNPLSKLQRDRLRVAIEKSKPLSYIRNILHTGESPFSRQEVLDTGRKPLPTPAFTTAPKPAPTPVPTTTTPTTPNDLVPALRSPSSGKVYVGNKGEVHNDIRMREARAGNADVVDSDVEHGFVNPSKPDEFLSRVDASKAIGETEPLQSERLNDLQKLATREQSDAERRKALLTDVEQQHTKDEEWIAQEEQQQQVYNGVKPDVNFPPSITKDESKTSNVDPIPRNALIITHNFFADNRANKSFRESRDATLSDLAGHTNPKTVTAEPEVGEQLITYGSSRVTAPALGKALASRVLGEKWNDKAYAKELGAAVTQDRLDALRVTHEQNNEPENAAAVKNVWDQPDSPFKSRADYRKWLVNKENEDAVQRHKDIVQPLATAQHLATGGKLARPGEVTGAFVNLIAQHHDTETGDIDIDAERVKSLIYGSRKGDLTNPLRKGSVFSKQAKGTADSYDLDYRHIAERMVKGNYEQAQLRRLYDLYLRHGLAVEMRPGVPPPDIGGKPGRKIQIDVRATPWGTIQRKNLWVRADLAEELHQALSTDQPVRSSAVTAAIGALNDIQITGPTDLFVHLANLLGYMGSSQGGRIPGVSPVFSDVMRAIPGVRGLDTIVRMSYYVHRAMTDSPEVQEAVAKFSEVGAGRSYTSRPSLLGKVVDWSANKVLPPEVAEMVKKYTSTDMLIKTIDKAGRLAGNDMYEELVRRGWAKDTPMDRREFINGYGQYNSRLRSKLDGILREYGVSPFIVAGKNFNRIAIRRLLMDPMVSGANPQAVLKLRLMSALGVASSAVAIPITLNCMLTGQPFGRKDKNIPYGAIDTGKDDKDGNAVVIDLLHGDFLRRAFGITGASGFEKAHEQQQTVGQEVEHASRQMLAGFLGPSVGPGPSAAWTLGTGKDFRTDMTVSDNTYSLGQNAWAALTRMNPSIAAAYKGWYDNQGGKVKDIMTEELGQLRRAAGISSATSKSLVQQEHEAGVETMSLSHRANVEKQIETNRKPLINIKTRSEIDQRRDATEYENLHTLQNNLSKDVQQFISEQQLRLPTYAEKIYLPARGGSKGQDITLFSNERIQLGRLMTKEYQVELERLKNNPRFRELSQEGKQKALGTAMAFARKRAKQRMEELMSEGER